MMFGKLLSITAHWRRPPAIAASPSAGPNPLLAAPRPDTFEVKSTAAPICRESLQVYESPSSRALLRPGRTPTDAMGRVLCAAKSIPDLIALLEKPESAKALQAVRRLSFPASTGQADVSQFNTICAQLAQKCPALEQLAVADAMLSTTAAQALSQLPALSVLSLNVGACAVRHRQPLPEGVLDHLAQSPMLHTLMLGNADLPRGGLTPLQNLASLRTLRLSNCAFYAHDVESIANLHALEAFYYTGNDDYHAVARAAAHLLKLEVLQLARWWRDDRYMDLTPLHTLRHLRRLHVDQADLTAAGLRALAKGCAVLQEVSFRESRLHGSATTGALCKFKRLRSLRFLGESEGMLSSTSYLLALRKHRLTDLRLPGQDLSGASRRTLLGAFGPAALTYCTAGARLPWSTIESDRQWLIKSGRITADTLYPITFA